MPHLLPLTSLRFFFALAVFFHHCHFLVRSDAPGSSWLYHRFFAEGYIGVTFFFILSGFILAYSYQRKILSKQIGLRRFYRRRFARIYPLHLLTLLLAIPVNREDLTGTVTAVGAKLLAHLTLTQSLWLEGSVYRAFNNPSWSISDEVFFYLLFPALVLAVGRVVSKFGLPGLPWLAATVFLVPTAITVVPETLHHALFYVHPITRVADFFLGVLLFQLYDRTKKLPTEGPAPAAGGREMAVVAVFVLFVSLSHYVHPSYRYASYYWLPMLLVIYVFAQGRGVLSRLLAARWLVYGGEISFALYMIHRPLMRYYFKVKQYFIGPGVGYLDLVLLLCAATVLSHFVYRYVEMPANRWLRGQRRAKKAP